jgi:hypothetical protein
MASRKKPTSKAGARGAAQTPAKSSTRTRLAEGQGLVPTLVPAPAAKPAMPSGRPTVKGAPAKPARNIKLSGVAIKKVLDNLSTVVGKVVQATQPPVALPSRLLGTLQEPDSSLGINLQIEVLPPPPTGAAGVKKPFGMGTSGSQVMATGLSDNAGNFSISLPGGVVLPSGASLSLRVRGSASAAVVTLNVSPDLLGPTGYIGTTKMDKQLAPIPAAVLAQLQHSVDQAAGDSGNGPTVPKLTLGDDADCIRVLENQTSFERFPYGIFFQLIAPALFTETETVDPNSTGIFDNTIRVDTPLDRIDLAGPISVDEFREALLTKPAIVGSLGLGYVLRCGQNWQFQGLALGDLVYSLPLAPGEQQQIVVEEQSTTLTVREFDSVIASDSSSATQVSDSSSRATFDSALQQSAQGGSTFASASETSSMTAGGGLLGLLGGPSGSLGETVSGGSTHNWMDGLQNYGSSATQAVQTYAEQQAHSQRSAQRTAMRMASSSESTSVKTKTITNHNKLHALTMQYFEVLRQFDISTTYDGVSLVCLVPLDIVWFLPPGQKVHLDDLISNSDLSNAIQWSSQLNTAIGGMIALVQQAIALQPLPFFGGIAVSLAEGADAQLQAATNQANQLAAVLSGLGATFSVQTSEVGQFQTLLGQAKTSVETFIGSTQMSDLQACLQALQSARPVILALYQQLSSPSLTGGISRHDVLNRYAGLLAHSDVLTRWLPAQYTTGMSRLERFAADPRASLALDSLAEDVIRFSATATVLPFDHVYVAAVTRWGSRLGPVEMIPTAPVTVPGQFDTSKAFKTDADLIQYLQGQRNPTQGSVAMLQASIALPRALSPTDVVGFEITRRTDNFTYQFATPIDIATALLGVAAATWPAPVLGIIPGLISPPLAPQAKTYPATLLIKEIGAPSLWNFRADLTASVAGNPESYVKPDSNAVELPAGIYPIPAMEVAPLLKYSDLIQIENTLQHVLRNIVRYSKAVWSSLTPEERVMLLEPYLLSFPGLSSTVPLLDCIGNEVLGFYGNSMLVPFSIPQALGDVQGWSMTTGQLEDSLLHFHRQGAASQLSHASLPTRGVLGEAMLGHCASGEKIDLTRFWNWQDSPTDPAPTIAPVTVPSSQVSALAGAQVGSQLSSMLPNLINNNNVAPAAQTPNSSFAQALISAFAAVKGLDPSLSGADKLAALLQNTQNTAESARSDMVKANTQITSQALSTLGTILAAPSGSGGGKGGSKKGGTDSSSSGGDSSGSSDSGGGGSNAGEIITAVLPLIIAAFA